MHLRIGEHQWNQFLLYKIVNAYLRFRKHQFEKIDVPCTEANISGSGNVLLNGKSGKAEYRIAGSGDINAIDLKTEDVNAHISGSGSIKCHATENLTGGVSGSGSVAYKGNPQINFSKRGLRKL